MIFFLTKFLLHVNCIYYKSCVTNKGANQKGLTMPPIKKNANNFDVYEKLYSKQELLNAIGIEARTLTYWISEGILPPPVLYKGRGRQGFFSKRQILHASIINRLNSAYKQSITGIKTIIKRIKEDIDEDWPYGDSCYLTVFNDKLGLLGEAVSTVYNLEAFKAKKKTLIQRRSEYQFIETVHHSKKYIVRDGQILQVLYDYEFDEAKYFTMDNIDRCFEMWEQALFEIRRDIFEQKDIEFVPNPEEWKRKSSQIVQLVEKGIMYKPSYYYDGNRYFSENDIILTSDKLLTFCYDLGFRITGGTKLTRRIKEDIERFFSFSENSPHYSPESILFYKTVDLFSDCILWLLDYSDSYRDYGLDAYAHKKVTSFKQFLNLFLEGLIYITQDALGDMILFKITPLRMMNDKQLSKALKIGLLGSKEVKSHLKKRINSTEKELARFKKLYDSLEVS